VFDALGVQVPEEIDQPVPLSQTGVEAVLEWRELPPVGRLVGGLQHVEVTEQQERRVGGRGVEGGTEPLDPGPLPFGLVQRGVVGGHVGTHNAQRPVLVSTTTPAARAGR